MSYKARIFTREEFGNVIAAPSTTTTMHPRKSCTQSMSLSTNSMTITARKPRWRNETTSV